MNLEEVIQKFKSNPKYIENGAGLLAKKFNCSKEDIYAAKRAIRGNDKKKVKYDAPLSENTKAVNNDSGTLESVVESTFEPKSDLELAELHKVDLTKYRISSYWSKLKSNGKFTSSLNCTLIKVDNDVVLQKDLLLKELKAELKRPFPKVKYNSLGMYAYELSLFDHHFGKLAWGEESGEDYDLKIAEDRYREAISNLLSYVDLSKLEKIILPIGNDMINISNRMNQTYAGTPQDSDSRFYKMVRAVKNILIETIDYLSTIAPVDVIVVAGNHDPEAMFMIGEILDAYYHSASNINVDNSPKQRKYYQYGKCGFQYTHGNEEKHQDLGLIFATEMKDLWAATEFRFAKLGHFHKSKKINYVSIDEFQGFQVQICPSLSSADFWHSSKGYMSKKASKAFLYHKDKGQVGEFTYNV